MFVGRRGATPPIKDDNGKVVPGSIASLEKVQLGGIEQWILIRGQDASNPILLWLHGGPGAAQMPVARTFNGDLEKVFVVVHWDQRGAGKSNAPDFDEQTMTLQQFIDDAHELTLYLKTRFHREKIYLVGHSWGAQLGIKVAQAYPEDYYAYVGVGQVVAPALSQEVGRAWLLAQIEEKGDEKNLEGLQALGAPPYMGQDDYVTYARMIDAYGGDFDVDMGKLFWIALRAPEYTAGDLLAAFRGMNRGSGPMWGSDEYQSYNTIEDIPQLRLPVYFFNGRHDYITPLQVTQHYFELLEAPEGKKLVIFEQSAHTPFMAEAEKFNRELISVKQATLLKQSQR
jgi:pimeloyl-ACP methyl ester carboxylesterase